ncbi:MAG: aromatic ring-hydroxylating dioxygenase subunit alpha [Pseudomonadota bacterium]|nr:aromatic ring-hydroxylating dioxygenase subunit alpha [Pseudomonadota bacterium]
MFLQNAWYVAAWDSEIGDGPFSRTILNEPVVMFRTPNGIVALDDRCCHRALPLSMGKVLNDRIQCGYHGLEFDASGACVNVPGQSKIPPGAQVRSYPVIERWGMVWVWTGEREKAHESLLPDWWWLDNAEWKNIPGRGGTPMPVAANYLLISDNLFDITHLSYVHLSSIGTDAIVDFPAKTERFARSIKMTRMVEDRPPAPFYQKAGGFEGNVDRFIVTTSDMPGYIVNHAGTYKRGVETQPGQVTEDIGVEMKVMNMPTPESETSTHYFYSHARHFKVDDPTWDDIYRTQFTQVFEEDQAILNAQQTRMSSMPEAPEIDVNSDSPNIQVRKLMKELIASEQCERSNQPHSD